MAVEGAWKAGTVADVIQWLIGRKNLEEITWPPDLFAIAASVLQRSGTYPFVVESWPPGRTKKTRDEWIDMVTTAAVSWRKKPQRPPMRVSKAVSLIVAQRDTELFKIRENRALCNALLEVCAIADEACVGVGIPGVDDAITDSDPGSTLALLIPVNTGETTLCTTIHPSKLRVLPKLHTPQSGMTVRSLTHHLALCESGEVDPEWLNFDFHHPTVHERLNLLMLPWPLSIVPSQFAAVPRISSRLPCMPSPTYGGFFEYTPTPETPDKFVDEVLGVLDEAMRVVGEIDGVVLPELAMTEPQYDALRSKLIERNLFVLGGVAGSSPTRNFLVFDFPLSPTDYIHVTQDKHHRWQLDRRQIIQYGLGSRLDPTQRWWEQISICDGLKNRRVNFVALRDWLTLTPLICEDLARQEPVGELVRAVGPNLVIALLMDGPQLSSRWPGRYATVLADDPGCSVLTVSSYGMVALCKPPPGASPSRTVAMWKDAKSGEVVHLDLPAGKRGIVLSISRDWAEEFSADGRSDGGSTGYPILSGVHAV